MMETRRSEYGLVGAADVDLNLLSRVRSLAVQKAFIL